MFLVFVAFPYVSVKNLNIKVKKKNYLTRICVQHTGTTYILKYLYFLVCHFF